MKQRQLILAVVVVGAVAVALWVWRDSWQQPEVAMAPAKTAPMRDAFHQSSAPASPSGPAPAAQPTPAAAAAPEVDQRSVSAAQAQPPQNVDTPEPADRKFARGARADESNQNQN